jgi:uncharacterized membrane protein
VATPVEGSPAPEQATAEQATAEQTAEPVAVAQSDARPTTPVAANGGRSTAGSTDVDGPPEAPGPEVVAEPVAEPVAEKPLEAPGAEAVAEEPPGAKAVAEKPLEDPGAEPVAEEAPPDAGAEGAATARPWLQFVPVTCFMVAYALYYSHLTVQIYRGYGEPGYDLGIFDQGVWLLSRFHAPFVTIMGRDLFGDHTSFILLLLVPVYWVYAHATALLVIQSWLLALGALPVYLLGRHLLRDNMWATLLAGAFLLNPALQWGNLEQFHPECFLVPLVGFAIYAAVVWKPWLLVLSVVGCLLVKEDVALFVIPLGLWVAWRRNWALGLKLIAAAILAALIATEVVIRSLLGIPTLYANRVPFGGIGGFFAAIFTKSRKVFDYLTSQGRLAYLWQMSLPSALMFLWNPEVALIGVLVLASNLISNFPYQHEIQYHYSLATVAALAMGTVFAIGSVKSARVRTMAVTAVVLCSVFSCYQWGGFPPLSRSKVPHWNPSMSQVHDINTVAAALPPNAVVSASDFIVPHVDHRVLAYQWPNPFRAEYWGEFKQEGQALPFASKVQYLLLPVQMSADDQVVFDHIQSQFVVVKEVGYAMLLKRKGT